MQLLSSVLLSGGSIIDLDGTIFVQFGLFFLAFILFRSLFFKPMIALFEAREERIDGARAKAKQLESEASEKGETFEEEMRKVRLQAGEERERLRKEGQRLEKRILEDVRVETQNQQSEAEAKLRSQANTIRKELDASVPVLATQIASKLLQREVQ